MNTFFIKLIHNRRTANQLKLDGLAGRYAFIGLLLFQLLGVLSVRAQNLPNYTAVTGTQLTNTNGQWVTVNPAQPNNIDLLESRIFKMPAAGQGILKVEFKLVGGDGGTAHYNSGAYNTFANGGRGGEVNFTLNLQSTHTYGKPFLVTFGKKGESTMFNWGMYCSAGGGGSTGMAWLEPGIYNKDMNKKWGSGSGKLIAAAGGGGGGFATGYESVHGKNATRDASWSNGIFITTNLFSSNYVSDALLVSGGSGFDNGNNNPESCCTNEVKRRQTSSIVYPVFDYQTGIGLNNSGTYLNAVTHGQGGGKPTTLYDVQDGSPNANNIGVAFGSGSSAIQNPVLKPGGRGGSGMAGGGAGSSTIGHYDAFIAFFPYRKNNIPTSGAGGTGTIAFPSYPHNEMEPGDDGYNDYSSFLEAASVSTRSSTNSPKSGYLMYRTVWDNEAPVIITNQFTIKLGPEAHTLTLADVQDYITDNDSIKSITFTPAQLTCNDVDKTIPVIVSASDFAGNSRTGALWITVQANNTPVAVLPEVSPYLTQPDFPRRINITNATYTLTAANFPPGVKGCTGSSGITIHFAPTTFNCASVGNHSVDYYYTDGEGNSSPVYTKIFIVTFSGATTGRLYVDNSATGANNGSSWVDAFTNLQDALKCAGAEGREVYVAKGTYRPDRGMGMTANDRYASFILPENFKLYGGFPSGGDNFDKRNPTAHITILSGEIGSAAFNDNSYHVVSIPGSGTTLDGFTVRDGHANVNYNDAGGGLNISQKGSLAADGYTNISNCKFLHNYGFTGGAVNVEYANDATDNYLNFRNCLFKDNYTESMGGAVSQTIFSRLRQSFINCIFNNNHAGWAGAAIKSIGEIEVTNCTFANNWGSATIYSQGVFRLHNSIIYHSSEPIVASGTFHVDYSNIEGSGGSTGWNYTDLIKDFGHNIDVDPLFHTSPELSLLPQSPSRNTGSNSYNSQPYDIANNARVSQGTIDMGAYELSEILYVDADAPAGGDGNTWATAMNNLSSSITEAGITGKDIWIKEGTYVPDRIPGSNTVTPNSRENSFNINNQTIYGGFDGTETSIAQRNIGQHPTKLSGDIGLQNIPADNAYHVVTVAGNVRLDGLIIENGYASGNGEYSKGAGVYQLADATDSSTVVSNITFRNNVALDNGGAWYTTAGSPGKTDFAQCIFYANRAARGAAAFLKISPNNSDSYDFNFYNVTALGNATQSTVTGAFEAEQSVAAVPARINAYNSIWSGNAPQNYSDVTNPGHIKLTNTYTATAAGVFVDVNNVGGADGKIMTADDGLRLSTSSPAISYGNNTLAYPGIEKDVANNPRVINVVDAGAYESEYTAPLIADAAGIIHVKPNATGNGTDWNNPTGDLHNAIQANGVQKVFVAKGNYPVGDNSFIMKNGVAIYGGFDPENGITGLSHRRIMPNGSALQGSVLDGQNMRPVIWNVFTASSAMDNSAVLDGFTIMKGAYSNGAGVRNVYASPTLNNLLVVGNIATISGGGVYNDHSSPLLTNAVISSNFIINVNPNAAVSGAGVANVASSDPVLTNVTLAANTLIAPLGTTKGAGLYSHNSSPKIYNSIIWNNQKMYNPTAAGSDLEKEGSGTLTLKNSMTQSYSTGSEADNNKVNVTPLFVSERYTDYRLLPVSQAIDAGNNSLYTGLEAGTQDLAGNPRVYDFANNRTVDIGAYEYQCVPVDYSNVVFENVTVDYDGNPHSITVQHLPQGVSVTYEIKNATNQSAAGNTATRAGVYTITATLSVAGGDCTPEIRTATLTIAKAVATITANATQSFVYDGTVKNTTASLNHTEATLTYSPQQGYTEAGGYWMTVFAPETDNYLPVSENIALVIDNANLTGITLNNAVFTYDSTPKSLAITGDLPPGTTVVYGGNEKDTIGTYTVVALIQRPNYNDLWLTAEMTINAPLPVRWISFTARLSDDNHGILDWKVDQTNVLDFQIERSSNAKDFRAISTVPASNSEGIATYRLIDPVAATGTVYYRIKQTDLDGTYGYSRIVSVSGAEGIQLNAYPNPVDQKVTVQVSADYVGTSLKLANTVGIVLQQLMVTSERFELNLDGYPAGVYLLYTWDGRAVKLIKN